jgi:hypothetical protein
VPLETGNHFATWRLGPGVDANAWHEQLKVCVCGLAPRLDELLETIEKRLAS